MNNSYIRSGQSQVYDNNSALIYYNTYGALNNNNRNNTNNCRPFVDFHSRTSFPDSFLSKFIIAFYAARKGKRKTTNENRFELDWENKLLKLAETVWNCEYVPKRSIAFVITKPKPREIEAADFSDRIVQQFLIGEIGEYIEKYLSPRQFSCRIGKGTDAAVYQAQQDIYEVSGGYTRQAWIIKLDIKGFFMSIDKTLVVGRLSEYIDKVYQGKFKDVVMYLIRILYGYMPIENCVRKSPPTSWDVIEDSKSLFKCDYDRGLPIGNVHVQVGANFLTSDFMSYLAEIGFKNVVNYTDDFLIVTDDLAGFKAKYPLISNYVESNLHLKLNVRKLYCQSYQHGVNFLGRTIKFDRIYAGNRTVHNAFERVRLDILLADDVPSYMKNNANHFCSSCNSVFGMMKNYCTYNIRKRLADMINATDYSRYMTINKDLTKWTLKNKSTSYNH